MNTKQSQSEQPEQLEFSGIIADPAETHFPNQTSEIRNQKLSSPHPKSSLAGFTPDQLAQISTWVQTEKYDKASDLILEKFGRKISTGALCRFLRNTVAIVEQLEDTPQTAAAAAEILQLAASANHKFTEASLHVLEQTAFKLSITCAHKTSNLDLLNRINNIICRSRNTAVRERHATVQEKKTDLRTRELDLKHQIFHARLDGRLNSSGRLNRTLNPNRNLFSEAPGNTPIQNPAHPVNPVEDNSTRPKIKILIDEDGEAFTHIPGPCPLPDDIIIKNHAYAKKLLAGRIDPQTGEELPAAPSSNGGTSYTSPTSISRDEITPSSAIPADPKSLNIESISEFKPDIKNQTSEIPSPSSSANSASSALKSETRNQKSEIPANPVQNSSSANSAPSASSALNPDLFAAVDRYTVDRAREYIAHDQKYTPWPYRHSPPAFITEARHCPCGHTCPCPLHETIPNIGPFPPEFWSLSPFSADYAACLEERNLPYRQPKEYLA